MMCLQPALAFVPFYNGPIQEGKEKFKALYDVGPVADMTQEMPYEVINSIQVSLKPCVPAPGAYTAIQNPMASHGDRKLFKVAVIADVSSNLVSYLFEQYSQLTSEYPETAQ